MKKNKLITILLTSTLATSILAGCAVRFDTQKEGPNKPIVEEVSSKIAKAGLGIITSISKSKDLGEDGATAQVESTMASVGFDKDGKIVSVFIDVAQNKVTFDEEMQVTSNLEEVGKTKKELKEDYGMKGSSKIDKEWYEQIEALEKWMIGKTVEEVKAMKTSEEDLKSSVTITVDGYIAAVEKATVNAVDVAGETLGLGQNISLGKSKSQGEDKGALAQVDTTVAMTVLDKDGKVAITIIDTAQTKVQYDINGVIETSKEDQVQTKKELGEKYGMKGASKIEKEWFEQIGSLEKWMTGKTVEKIMSMNLDNAIPTEEDLVSTVTIKVSGYLEAFKEASELAK